MALKTPLRLAAACLAAGFGLAAISSQSTSSIPKTAPQPQAVKASECSIQAEAGLPWSGHPVEWRLQPVPGAKPGSYEEVSRLLTRADWEVLNPGYRNLVRGQIRAARTGQTPISACFAPGTKPEVVQALRKLELALSPFRLLTRWHRTATTATVNQGGPMVLTWNIVPDGTPIPNEFDFDPTATVPSNLQAFAVERLGGVAALRAKFRAAFARYEELSGIRYVEITEDDGAVTRDSTGVLGVRADIRIGGTAIDGTKGILAYNSFPDSGDMVIDTTDETYSDEPTPGNPLPDRTLYNILTHEHGHGLGQMHTCPLDATKLMEPFLNTTFEGPQLDDIIGLQHFYGDTYEYPAVNNSQGAATALGPLGVGTKTVSTVSLGYSGDTDFYRFKTDAPNRALQVSLSLPGAPYQEGPQLNTGGCGETAEFNPLNRRNLALRVLNSAGTVLAKVNQFPAGQGESLTINSLSGTGPFFVQVYATDGTNNAQLYTLNITVQDPTTEGIATVSGRCVSIYANGNFNGSARSGLNGARVFLKRGDGTIAASTTTDNNGNYSFTKVLAGNYTMTAEYDRDLETVITMDPPTRSVSVGAADLQIPRFALYSVFGFVRAPDKQGDILAVPGAVVRLLNPKGIEIGNVTTGSDGKYEFPLQRAATFTVKTSRANLVFPDQEVTTPSTGSAWSPATRKNIIGTRAVAAGKTPSGASS